MEEEGKVMSQKASDSSSLLSGMNHNQSVILHKSPTFLRINSSPMMVVRSHS